MCEFPPLAEQATQGIITASWHPNWRVVFRHRDTSDICTFVSESPLFLTPWHKGANVGRFFDRRIFQMSESLGSAYKGRGGSWRFTLNCQYDIIFFWPLIVLFIYLQDNWDDEEEEEEKKTGGWLLTLNF